ncbi:MAG: ribonuclease D [Coriobacteriia bacterium]|nr:ribonuclease D [Coriobacteriia bacterium]
MYVTDTGTLCELVAQLRKAPIVAIDTEFMRERTYYAKLCLIQVASDDVAAIIDPLVIDDLSPLGALLADPAVVKVFHSGSQDLEIFYRLCGEATMPVFDTQIAATLAGFPQQVGYGALVKEMMDVTLDKSDTYTDWAKRPLSETQVEYALNDVRYLPEMYRRLCTTLKRDGRLDWLASNFAHLENPATYMADPLEQWRRVKRVSSLNRRQLAVAREVAAWRELEAQRRDIPKRWLIGDESIIEIARRVPKTVPELMAIRGVADKIGAVAQKSVIESVARGLAVPDDELPALKKRRKPLGDIDAAVDLMVAIVRLRARERDVAMPLLASRDDLEHLAAGERETSPLLEGWRKEMVGDELRRLLDGEISMRLSAGTLVVEPLHTDGQTDLSE